MTVELITQAEKSSSIKTGYVALVGAGPGDPELLTIKALRAIEHADLILFDNLVSDEIRALFPSHTKAIYVGKKKADHCIPQEKLNLFMAGKARQGLNICRLKGGDPFVFGRGSEEQQILHEQGIRTVVIPGITAASGCTAYAGIPLTHRSISTGCTFVTGHLKDGRLDLNWSQLAGLQHTLVFYMGLGKLTEITEQLITHGLAADTPAALIENGCTPQQRKFTGTVKTLPSVAVTEKLQSPSLIVIGEVVSLAAVLSWQATQPGSITQEMSAQGITKQGLSA